MHLHDILTLFLSFRYTGIEYFLVDYSTSLLGGPSLRFWDFYTTNPSWEGDSRTGKNCLFLRTMLVAAILCFKRMQSMC